MLPEDRWLLPEGIEEILPPAARRLERLRRELLDCYECWGYELVVPPLIEFLESLLTGAGNDLDLQTFKLTDQLSGRMLGVRADMTPQVAQMMPICLSVMAQRGCATWVRCCGRAPMASAAPEVPIRPV